MADIGLNQEVVDVYREWKVQENRAYIVLTISGREVVVEELGDLLPDDAYSLEKCKEVFETLKAGLKVEEPKCYLFAVKYNDEGHIRRKIVLIIW